MEVDCETLCKHECVDLEWIKKNNITIDTKPHKYVNSLLPFIKNVVDWEVYVSFELLMRWKNLKTILAGAGLDGTYYDNFIPFTPRELCQHLGAYVLNGSSPLPHVEQKFKSQSQDPVHGKDFVYNALSRNTIRRHKYFKAFFACQNPVIQTPCRNKTPNRRCDC